MFRRLCTQQQGVWLKSHPWRERRMAPLIQGFIRQKTTETLHLDEFRSILVSPHARERRLQRKIRSEELRAVIRNGTQTVVDNGRLQFSFHGVTVITDCNQERIITSWADPGFGIDIMTKEITPEETREHEIAVARLKADKTCWTSHTVAVVDQSGSMRRLDVSEYVTRSDLVWLALATKVVGETIRSGERGPTDVFSVVGMQGEGRVLLKEQPYDWILYNKLVGLLRSSQPRDHGNFLPSLRTARDILLSNSFSGCALALVMFSDGMPSDATTNSSIKNTDLIPTIKQEISEIASQLGNRLTVVTIGIGVPADGKFGYLRLLLEEAKRYGSNGIHQAASLSTDIFATTLAKLTSTLTSTMTAMTEMGNTKQRHFREFRTEPLENVGVANSVNDEFELFRKSSRQIMIGGESRRDRNITKLQYVDKEWKPVGKKDTLSAATMGVAIKKKWFGCGAERLVKEYREVDHEEKFVGEVMVAKDTKFVQDGGSEKDAKNFHYGFARAQSEAKRCADIFNKFLCQTGTAIGRELPSIEFLECSLYLIKDPPGPDQGYLVERMLDVKNFEYTKWNDNKGGIRSSATKAKHNTPIHRIDLDNIDDVLNKLQVGVNKNSIEQFHADLDVSPHVDTSMPEARRADCRGFDDEMVDYRNICIEDEDIPQAFSCFSYHLSRRKLVVCDLQGIFNTNVQPPVYELTDPAIHYYTSAGRKRRFGQSDLGKAGIEAFLNTCKCTNLCRLLRRRILADDGSAVKFR